MASVAAQGFEVQTPKRLKNYGLIDETALLHESCPSAKQLAVGSKSNNFFSRLLALFYRELGTLRQRPPKIGSEIGQSAGYGTGRTAGPTDAITAN